LYAQNFIIHKLVRSEATDVAARGPSPAGRNVPLTRTGIGILDGHETLVESAVIGGAFFFFR
jgi:hypothetical protein